MRIVLDTNVLISGTFWSGPSLKILTLISEKKHVLIVSPEILEEYRRVLLYPELAKKVGHYDERRLAVQKIIDLGHMVYPKKKVQAVLEDPDDDKFIEGALEGKADCIVSQDRHLLDIGRYAKIRILTPQKILAGDI